MQNTRYISKQDEKNYPYLTINTVYGNAINNETLIITAGGLKGTKRGVRDGVVIFGASNSADGLKKMIDYELNIPEESVGTGKSTSSSIMFFIYFNKDNNNFYIRAYKSKNQAQKEYFIPNVIVQVMKPYVSCCNH